MTARRSLPRNVVWSLERAGKEATGTRSSSSGRTSANFKIDGNKITGDVSSLTNAVQMDVLSHGYILPKAYYERSAPTASRKRRSEPARTWSTNSSRTLRPAQGNPTTGAASRPSRT